MSMAMCMRDKKAQNVAFQKHDHLFTSILRRYFCPVSGMTGEKVLSCGMILKKQIRRTHNLTRSRET